jgi:hypothetical protein
MSHAAKDPIAWQDAPTYVATPFAPILKISPGAPVELVILSEQVVGLMTHFTVDGRTVPCTAGGQSVRRECHIDHTQVSTRWQGWIAVQRPMTPYAQMIALTPAAVRDCPFLLDKTLCLRGRGLLCGRRSNSKNSALVCRPSTQKWEKMRLAAAPDVRAFLVSLWGPLVLNALGRGAAAAYDAQQRSEVRQ